jgi:CDP-diacylglycerol--glycerol-3-phosphate 3-phosphatidyltransferase
MIDLKARSKLAPVLDPIGRGLARTGISPTAVTILGGLVAVGGAVLIGAGWLAAGAAVAGFGALIDAFDGPLARARGDASIHGAFIDTMTDRLGELALFVGLIWYVRDDPAGIVLVALSLGFSMLIPYVRAKAEAFGAEGRGGWMGRAERVILILVGVGLEGFGLTTLYPALWALTVLSGLTVAQRIRKTWDQLTAG